ncbi:MAG TPA: hypothetical protein VE975_05780 [Actinomycetota bacterium]|nr:hypothetical protein [Actinomycetota bacterium]
MGQLRASSEAPAAGAETFGQTSFDPGVLRVLEAVARGALGPGYEDGVPSRMAEILGAFRPAPSAPRRHAC